MMREMPRATVAFKPPGLSHAGGYELDRFVVEYDDAHDTLDFRLELGVSVGIYWALPAAPNDRLQVFLVDGAAFHVDEWELQLDPFCCHVPRFEFRPDLTLSGGRTLVAVAFEAGLRPGRYRCEFSLLGADGQDELRVLAWERRLEGGLPGLRSWLTCVVRHFALPDGELEDFELSVKALLEAGQLDARQGQLASAVASALRARGDPKPAQDAAMPAIESDFAEIDRWLAGVAAVGVSR